MKFHVIDTGYHELIKSDYFIIITTFANENVKLAKELTIKTKVPFLHILEQISISKYHKGLWRNEK